MAKGTVKKRMTPSASRKKKALQRIRKKSRAKDAKKQPSWKASMMKSYTKKKRGADGKKGGGEEGEDGSKRKRGRFANEEGDEVQEEINEDKMKRLNERDPLETQIFLKHLPLDATEAEVLDFFRRFGDVRRAFLVRSRATGVASGTGFLHCGSTQLVDTIMNFAQQTARELSAMNRDELKKQTETLSHHQAKKMQYKLRTDTVEVRDPFVVIRDTRVTVHRVLSRTDSQEATSAMQKKKKRTKVAQDDPRNLYLLQEGQITADSPAAKGLPPQYVAMLEADYEARRSMLRNVTMFVSKTRLNVRNLPKSYSEKDVRQLFANHARAYLKDHKEDMDKEHWGKYGPIKNVKLLKDTAGTSKGYAFVEFINHNVALHVLRALNNNPTLFGESRRLVVSFAIENMNAIQKLQRIREIKKNRLSNTAGGDEEVDSTHY